MVNILLIDQEPLFQQAFSKMITETEDCQLVGIAENSKEAFEIISRYHPQVIFCDVVLGMENGIAVCSLIKEHFPETRQKADMKEKAAVRKSKSMKM